MLIRHTSMSSANYTFDVRDNPMYPRQKLSRSLRITKDNFVVQQILGFGHFSIGPPTIASDSFQKLLSFLCCRSTPKPFQKIFNAFCGGIVYDPHMRKAWLFYAFSISIKRYRTQNSAFRFAPSSWRCTPRSEVIMHFGQVVLSSVNKKGKTLYLMFMYL